MTDRLEAISTTSLPAIYSLGRLEGFAKDLRGTMRSHIVTTSPEGKAKIERTWRSWLADSPRSYRPTHRG